MQKSINLNLAHLNTLIVDDDIVVCEHTQMLLTDMGLKAQWVDSGRRAVEIVQQWWAEGRHFDIIFVDWKMPDMDGIETSNKIRKIVGPDVTIIIMTAYDWQSIEHEARLNGVNMLISKPMMKSSLTSAFRKIFEENGDKKPITAPTFDFSGKTILLVEDHELNIEVAKRLLEKKNMNVEVAKNGLKALQKFTLAPDGYYSAILMDIRMPVMDGLAATRNIRMLDKADAKSVPIIAMSANAFDEDVDKSNAAGMNAHLAKPIEPNMLYSTLNHFIFEEDE